MNLGHLDQRQSQHDSVASENDIDKLISICNSYGLNQDQTAQLIEEFRRGALFKSTQSYGDSLNQTLNEVTFVDNHEDQEYSFKHHKEQSRQVNQRRGQEEWIYMQDNLKSNRKERNGNQEPIKSIQCFQRLLQEKFTIEKDLVHNLQQENKRLISALQKKDQKIEELLDMKRQDTQIIIGLKDIIANLTQSLQQKELSYREVHQKYSNIIESKVKELSENKSSTDIEDYPLQDVSNNYNQFPRSSRIQKEIPQMKHSRQNTEGTEAIDSGKSSCGEANMKKSKHSSRIDIKKYKEMIENMRNNY